MPLCNLSIQTPASIDHSGLRRNPTHSQLLRGLTNTAMAQLQPTKEGTVPFRVPSIDKECFTFYKIFGDLSAGKPALVLMHGGPGAGHEYLLPFAELWPRYGIPVVFYDMIGCASSTHLPETKGDKNFWKPPLFFAELDNLLDQLKLRDYGFHLLGHSFGGMIGSEYASRRPQGLRKLVLASGLASKELSLKGFSTRKKQLPLEVQRVFDEGEKNKDFSSDEYKAAKMVFRKNFACRTDPMPTEMLAAIKNLSSDNTVHETM